MSENILTKPYTDKNYADFAVYANETQRRIEDYNGDKYALLTSELLDNGTIQDISQTPEYKLSQFQQAIQYQHDAFDEYAREIVYQIQYNTALGNTTLILNLEEQLQTEQQAVIARINAITEAYNNENNHQST